MNYIFVGTFLVLHKIFIWMKNVTLMTTGKKKKYINFFLKGRVCLKVILANWFKFYENINVELLQKHRNLKFHKHINLKKSNRFQFHILSNQTRYKWNS